MKRAFGICAILATALWASSSHSAFTRLGTCEELLHAHPGLSDGDENGAARRQLINGFNEKILNGLPLSPSERAALRSVIRSSSLITDSRKSELLQVLKKNAIGEEQYRKDLRAVVAYRIRQLRFLESMAQPGTLRYDESQDPVLRQAIRDRTPEGLVYEKLGYTLDGKTPNFMQFARNVQSLYEQKGVPVGERIVPTVPFQKIEEGQERYRHASPVEPLHEDWDMEISADGMLPGVYFPALAEGKIPVAGTHDVGHVVALLANDRYRDAIREAVRFHVSHGASEKRGWWIYYFWEMLSLPDPAKKTEMKSLLSFPGFGEKPTTLGEVREFFRNMDETELWRHATRLANSYENLFRHYGGGTVNPPERFYWYDEFGGFSSNRLTLSLTGVNPEVNEGYSPYVNCLFFGRDLRIALDFRGKENSDEAQHFFGKNTNLTPAGLRAVIEDYVSRMEYGLWEGTRFKPETLIHDLVEGAPAQARPFMEYLEAVYSPQSRFYRVMSRVTPLGGP